MLLLVLLYEADYPTILLLVLLYEADCPLGAIQVLFSSDMVLSTYAHGMWETRLGVGCAPPQAAKLTQGRDMLTWGDGMDSIACPRRPSVIGM